MCICMYMIYICICCIYIKSEFTNLIWNIIYILHPVYCWYLPKFTTLQYRCSIQSILLDTIFRGKATTENTNTAERAQIRPGCLALSLTKRYTNLKDTRDVSVLFYRYCVYRYMWCDMYMNTNTRASLFERDKVLFYF